MRQPQHNQHGRKPRGRSRKTHNPLSRVYDSNGPDTKIRGTATHIAEKYQSLARDAFSAGERIVAENYLQHAEHYLRIVATAQASIQPQESNSQGEQNHQGRNDNRNGGNAEASADGEGRSSDEGSIEPRQQSGNQQGRNRRGNRRRPYNADNEGSRNQPAAEADAANDGRDGENTSSEASPVAAMVAPIKSPSEPDMATEAPDGADGSTNGAAVKKPRVRRAASADADGDAPLAPKRRAPRRKAKPSDDAPEMTASSEAPSSEATKSEASGADASSSEATKEASPVDAA